MWQTMGRISSLATTRICKDGEAHAAVHVGPIFSESEGGAESKFVDLVVHMLLAIDRYPLLAPLSTIMMIKLKSTKMGEEH